MANKRKPPGDKAVRSCITLPGELNNRVVMEADSRGTSFSATVRVLLQEALENRSQHSEKVSQVVFDYEGKRNIIRRFQHQTQHVEIDEPTVVEVTGKVRDVVYGHDIGVEIVDGLRNLAKSRRDALRGHLRGLANMVEAQVLEAAQISASSV